MKFIKNILIKDILNYEMSEDISIFDELQNCSISVIIDLITIGNSCTMEYAEHILTEALKTMDMQEVVEQITYELIGRLPNDDDNENIDVKNMSFSNILEEFYTQIQTVDSSLSIGDFLNFSTRYMYTYADGLQKRYIHNKNKKYMEDYENVAMFMSALAGKLKECPRLNEDGTLHKTSLKDKIEALKARSGR